jgi:hypothetical protein
VVLVAALGNEYRYKKSSITKITFFFSSEYFLFSGIMGFDKLIIDNSQETYIYFFIKLFEDKNF